MEFKQKPMRTIEIRATANGGYLVNVGCTNFAYEDEEKMIADLGEYIRDPQGVEEQYNKHFKAYDDVECAPDRPSRAGGSIRETQPFAPVPETSEHERVPEPQPTDERLDPASDIESSGY